MTGGARTPEELELLLEDAFVTRDPDAVAATFAERGVLVWGDGPGEARGGARIAALAEQLWRGDRTYVAGPGRVVQAGDTAVVLGTHGLNVLRRGPDGGWRYEIALLHLDPTRERRTV